MANLFRRWVAVLTAATCWGMAMPTGGLTDRGWPVPEKTRVVDGVFAGVPVLKGVQGRLHAVEAPPVEVDRVVIERGADDRSGEQLGHQIPPQRLRGAQVPHAQILIPHQVSKSQHRPEVTKVPTWSSEQLANARVIAQVGRSLGASDRDILIGIMTAMQESGLRNLNYGDRDSVGLFQQRTPWGTMSQRMDPKESARMFFEGGHQGQRGLFAFKNRDTYSLTQAAQKVQVSAFPDAYAKHESGARQLLAQIGSGTIPVEPTQQPAQGLEQVPQTGQDLVQQNGDLNLFGAAGINSPDQMASGEANGVRAPSAPGIESGDRAPDLSEGLFDDMDTTTPAGGSTFEDLFPKQGTVGGSRARVGQIARQLLGTPYKWGGTDPDSGLDCSGFVQYVLRQVGVNVPRISAQQAASGRSVPVSQLQAGDLVGWNNSSRNNGADHIAIYLGNGQIIEAPRPGLGVRIRTLDKDEGDYWGIALDY